MKHKFKPIKTVYKDHQFRSRLEARWAVFFEEMGLRYQYEPECFTLDKNLRYLPDFYLDTEANPSLGTIFKGLWLEVKPDVPNKLETEKAISLSLKTYRPVIVTYHSFDTFPPELLIIHPKGFLLPESFFSICPNCDSLCFISTFVKKSLDSKLSILGCSCIKLNPNENIPEWVIYDEFYYAEKVFLHDRLVQAYKAARFAKFRNGERIR